MALREIYIGSVGPLLYDDSEFDHAISVQGRIRITDAPVADDDVARKIDVEGQYVKLDGSTPLTADWPMGLHRVGVYIDAGGAVDTGLDIRYPYVAGIGSLQIKPADGSNAYMSLDAGAGKYSGFLFKEDGTRHFILGVKPGTSGYLRIYSDDAADEVLRVYQSGALQLGLYRYYTMPNTDVRLVGSIGMTIAVISASKTLADTDPPVARVSASAGAVTITLPETVNVHGKIQAVIKTDASANAVTVQTQGSDVLRGSGGTSETLSNQGDAVIMVANGSYNEWLIIGRS